jgi:pyridoxine 4-dehydrogenase
MAFASRTWRLLVVPEHFSSVAKERPPLGTELQLALNLNHYNLAHRADDPLIDDLASKGIAYVPFFPLGGFTPLQSATLSNVAERLGATPMQVALAWLLQRSSNILLIPGTSSIEHLLENLAAAKFKLSQDTLDELNAVNKVADAAPH